MFQKALNFLHMLKCLLMFEIFATWFGNKLYLKNYYSNYFRTVIQKLCMFIFWQNTKIAGETRQFLRRKGHCLRKFNLHSYSAFDKQLLGIIYELKTYWKCNRCICLWLWTILDLKSTFYPLNIGPNDRE